MPIPTDSEKRNYMFSDDMKFLQKVIIYHPTEDKILALKRPANAFSRANCWDLAGGNVLFGKLHLDSLIEEISEETSLSVDDIRPVQVITNFEKDKEIYYLFIGYRCRATSSNVKISDEHSEYKWVSRDEFYKLESADYLIDLVKLDEKYERP